MNNKIYFSLPGYHSHYRLNIGLLKIMKDHKEKFYEDIVIDSVYDCFPNCIWNGGRILFGNLIKPEEILNIIQEYNKFKVSIRHTFTNELLEEKHLYDTYGNIILELSKNSSIKTGITLNSPLFAKYIEENYKDYFYICWSATKCLNNIDEINTLSKNNLTIPSYLLVNNNWDKIDNLQYKDNIELIIDEFCYDNCFNYMSHYIEFNKAQLYELNYDRHTCMCYQRPNYYDRRTNKKHNISIKDIRDKYLPNGINKFKISGREEEDYNLIESYINYFVKPEWKDYIRNELLRICYSNKKIPEFS